MFKFFENVILLMLLRTLILLIVTEMTCACDISQTLTDPCLRTMWISGIEIKISENVVKLCLSSFIIYLCNNQFDRSWLEIDIHSLMGR